MALLEREALNSGLDPRPSFRSGAFERARVAHTAPAVDATARAAAVLRTERLILRAPRMDDAPAIAALANDRRIAENTARLPHPYRLADAETWIALTARPAAGRSFVVTLRDKTIIGGCGYGALLEPVPEIGYWFGAAFWGKGFATEAARAVIDEAFANEGFDEIAGGARVTNAASRRVIEKCGFTWTGVMLMRVQALGKNVPCDRFRLSRAAWIAASAPRLQDAVA